jgi:uncharacterized protein YidB (DUF937 family)
MKKTLKFRLAGAVAALVAVVGGGAAIAATQLTPEQRSDAIVADAAEQLGVEASELDAALTKALQNQVDAAVADGRLTEAQGEELKERIAAGDVPLVGLGPGGGPGGHGHHVVDLSTAADFLGVTESELRTALHEDGQTLAEVAEAEGKSVDGLVTALVTAARERLDHAVEDGRLTEAQRTEMLADLEERIRDVVDNGLPQRFGFRGEAPGAAFTPPAA